MALLNAHPYCMNQGLPCANFREGSGQLRDAILPSIRSFSVLPRKCRARDESQSLNLREAFRNTAHMDPYIPGTLQARRPLSLTTVAFPGALLPKRPRLWVPSWEGLQYSQKSGEERRNPGESLKWSLHPVLPRVSRV